MFEESIATTTTVRERRRADTRSEILAAAWEQCRRHGLAALSLRELANAVGMRAPSLYSYFDSKDAIYDAMFRQANEALGAWMEPAFHARPVSRETLKAGARRWVEFAVADRARFQLLFQHAVPGFEPSAESYALAVAHLDRVEAVLRDAGIIDPRAVDLWTAVIGGLTSQQVANDPGGDRWTRLVDDAVDMFVDHVLPGGELP